MRDENISRICRFYQRRGACARRYILFTEYNRVYVFSEIPFVLYIMVVYIVAHYLPAASNCHRRN